MIIYASPFILTMEPWMLKLILNMYSKSFFFQYKSFWCPFLGPQSNQTSLKYRCPNTIRNLSRPAHLICQLSSHFHLQWAQWRPSSWHISNLIDNTKLKLDNHSKQLKTLELVCISLLGMTFILSRSKVAEWFLWDYYKDLKKTGFDTSRKETMFEIFNSKNPINPWSLFLFVVGSWNVEQLLSKPNSTPVCNTFTGNLLE